MQLNQRGTEKSTSVWKYSLFTVLFLGMVPVGSVWAAANGCHNKGKFVGHYKGFLDLTPLGNPRFEEFQVTLQAGGTATTVVDEDGLEMETTALGSWRCIGKDEVEIGVIQIRHGTRVCAIISPPDGRDDDVCTLRQGYRVRIDNDGNMTGQVRAVVEELDDQFEFPALFPLVDVKRTSVDDFDLPPTE